MVTASFREETEGDEQDQILPALRYGQWPESKERSAMMSVSRSRRAASLDRRSEELGRLGVAVTLDAEGRARFRASRDLPPAAKRIVETHGDVIEAHLRDKGSNQC